MIAIEFHEGLYCPVVVCDFCRQQINDARWAMVAWGESKQPPFKERAFPSHFHKRECLDAFEESLPANERLMTEELSTHLTYLEENSRLIARLAAGKGAQ